MDKMRKAMLIVPIAIGLSGCNDGSSVGLENQDRCAQQAQRYFKADFFEEPTEFSNRRIDKWDYYTHYNSKLNKCFVRMWNIWSNENVARDVLWESQRLVDPFERKV